MIRLSIVVVLSTLVLLNCGLGGESKVVQKRDTIQIIPAGDLYSYICSNPTWAPYFSMCATTPAPSVTPASATSVIGTTTVDEIIAAVDSTTTVPIPVSTTVPVAEDTSSPTNLQLAHWCQFSNGSYVSYGQIFMYTACAICQCTQQRLIRCANLQCMPTYCIDGSAPSTRPGQCCSQCAYEQPAMTCTDNGITFPQGTLVRTTSTGVQCWCQQGGIECRQTSSGDSSTGMWGDNTASYIVIIVLCILLILGVFLCCGCTLFYYYYYQRNQQAAQVAYDQYWNGAGWQPMGEEELGAVDPNAEQKQAEAEQVQVAQGYPIGNGQEHIPPPYALYNGTYVTEENQQKRA